MKAAKDRLLCDGTEALNRPMERDVFVQRAMNPRFIIVGGILPQDPAQVRLPNAIMWSNWTRPRTLRCSTISCCLSAAFSASSRLLD
jgi:hypothetical protein